MSTHRHVVMMSSGAGSWAAAKRVVAKHGPDGVVLVERSLASFAAHLAAPRLDGHETIRATERPFVMKECDGKLGPLACTLGEDPADHDGGHEQAYEVDGELRLVARWDYDAKSTADAVTRVNGKWVKANPVPSGNGMCDNCGRDEAVGRCADVWLEPHTHPVTSRGPSIPRGLMLCRRCSKRLSSVLYDEAGLSR